MTAQSSATSRPDLLRSLYFLSFLSSSGPHHKSLLINWLLNIIYSTFACHRPGLLDLAGRYKKIKLISLRLNWWTIFLQLNNRYSLNWITRWDVLYKFYRLNCFSTFNLSESFFEPDKDSWSGRILWRTPPWVSEINWSAYQSWGCLRNCGETIELQSNGDILTAERWLLSSRNA